MPERPPPGTKRRTQAHCGPVLFLNGSWASSASGCERVPQEAPPAPPSRRPCGERHTAEELCPRAERRAPLFLRKTLLSPRTSRPAPAPTCCLAEQRDRAHVRAWAALRQAGSPHVFIKDFRSHGRESNAKPSGPPHRTFSGVCHAHSSGAELGAALLSPCPDTSG